MRIIHQRHILGRKTKQIARDLDMPLRVVQRILQMWAELSDLRPPSYRRNSPKLSSTHIEVCAPSSVTL